jgi:hypothetical protein
MHFLVLKNPRSTVIYSIVICVLFILIIVVNAIIDTSCENNFKVNNLSCTDTDNSVSSCSTECTCKNSNSSEELICLNKAFNPSKIYGILFLLIPTIYICAFWIFIIIHSHKDDFEKTELRSKIFVLEIYKDNDKSESIVCPICLNDKEKE